MFSKALSAEGFDESASLFSRSWGRGRAAGHADQAAPALGYVSQE